MAGILDSLRGLVAAVQRGDSRADSWQNSLTGLGVAGRDKLLAHAPGVVQTLPLASLESLYHGDAMAGRIVDKVVDDATRQGCEIVPRAETDEAVLDRVQKRWDALEAWQALGAADRWGRLYGAGYVLVGARDGRDMDQPLEVSAVREVLFLTVLDAQEVTPHALYADPTAAHFGDPEIYRVTPAGGRVSAASLIHETRLIRFGGAPTSRRRRAQMEHRDFSVLQRPFDALRRFDSDWRSASAMMADGSQGVLAIKDFADIIAGGSKDVFSARMEIINLCRSVSRIMPIDAEDESFSYVERTWSGIADLLDKTTLYLAAAADMPVTVLFGRSPAGMDATGEGDRIGWYDTVQHHREAALLPGGDRLLAIIAASVGVRDLEGWYLTCPPLLQESAADRAGRRKVIAETDALYIANDVATPEEIALARFAGGEWTDAPPTVDRDALEALLEADRKRALEGPPEPEALPEPAARPDPIGPADPVPAAADPAGPAAPPPVDAAKEAYNGAQVAALLDALKTVALGDLPAESVIAVLQVGFPVSAEEARTMVGPAAAMAAAKAAAAPPASTPPFALGPFGPPKGEEG